MKNRNQRKRNSRNSATEESGSALEDVVVKLVDLDDGSLDHELEVFRLKLLAHVSEIEQVQSVLASVRGRTRRLAKRLVPYKEARLPKFLTSRNLWD